jgi:hypothetical protein
MQPPDIDAAAAAVASHPGAFGLLGSLVGLRWAPGTGWPTKVANVASGTVLAGVLAPAVAERLHLSPSQISVTGLVIGLFGISIADAVTQAIRTFDLAGFLTRRFGGGQ